MSLATILRTTSRKLITVSALAAAFLVQKTNAQSIQALRSRASSPDEIRHVIDSTARVVAASLAQLDQIASTLAQFERGTPDEQTVARTNSFDINTQRQLARDVLSAQADPELFIARLRALDQYSESSKALMGAPGANEASRQFAAMNTKVRAAGGVPALHKLPGVNFVLGTGGVWRAGTSSLVEFELATNLVGAAAGSAFDALGSSTLKKYFEDNITMGTAFPLGSKGTLNATVGIGLGEIRIKSFRAWPALNLQQADSSDPRVPLAVRTASPTTANWSSPSFSVAFSPWSLEEIQRRFGENRAAPIITLGIRLPYYFPGDPFAATAALFSNKRSDFSRSGKIAFLAGVYIPLQELKALAP